MCDMCWTCAEAPQALVEVYTTFSELQVLRNGRLYQQSYSRGNPTSSMTEQPAPAGSYSSGTKVSDLFSAIRFLGAHWHLLQLIVVHLRALLSA